MKQHINEDIPINGRFEGKVKKSLKIPKGNQNP
jgi:hypothetical protein